MKVKHLKTGNIYEIKDYAIDCTNSRNGLNVLIIN